MAADRPEKTPTSLAEPSPTRLGIRAGNGARRMLDDLPNATLVEFLRRPGVRPEAPCFEDLAPVEFVLGRAE